MITCRDAGAKENPEQVRGGANPACQSLGNAVGLLMGFFLANPWGLLALAGVPAVIAIHLLRRRSREVRVSTLFLVEQALPASEGGRRMRRLRQSLPLWVQIAAVMALAWLLAGPRWVAADSTQTAVAVLDTSASLSAFRGETEETLRSEFTRLAQSAARTRWIVLDSEGNRLAAGDDREAVIDQALAAWRPALGTHDADGAFRLARSLAGEDGAVVFFTDRAPADPDRTAWVAVGSPLANAGFLGGEIRGGGWLAWVKNFSAEARTLRWRVEGAEAWQSVPVGAGAVAELTGSLPAGSDRILLELEGDRFVFDDRLPLLVAREKPLAIHQAPSQTYAELFDRLEKLAEPRETSATPDLVLAAYSPLAPSLPDGPAIVCVEDPGRPDRVGSATPLPENDPLMENLDWQGLIARETLGVPFRDGDTALLWQGSRPLIFLRPTPGGGQLIFNFDVRQSNAARLPAFPLLIHRFLDGVRAHKKAFQAANVETRQELTLTGSPTVRAPSQPEFFTVNDPEGTPLFDGAARFADPRESDFASAGSGRSGDSAARTGRDTRARGASLEPLWAAVLGGLFLWNWVLTGGPKDRVRSDRS